jgi:hypothetical protein
MFGAAREITPVPRILSFFAACRKRVISFAGFAELGYEDLSIVDRVATEILDPHLPNHLLVNSGTLLRVGGEDGIAKIYELAKHRGIETCGIHPSVALEFADTHHVSPYVDHVFFVNDSTWGGLLPGGSPSPTLSVILDISDELVMVGGGKHAADELLAFTMKRKSVRYFPAEMNRRVSNEWSRRSGVVIDSVQGAAFHVWSALPMPSHESPD